MSKHDDKIKNLLAEINAKRSSLGTKPKGPWKTNGILKVDSGININVVSSLEQCVSIAARLISEKISYDRASVFLELPEKSISDQMALLNDSLDDVKLRSKMIVWEQEKKKLEAMEKKLKDLRSEDAKTEDALADIENSLK